MTDKIKESFIVDVDNKLSKMWQDGDISSYCKNDILNIIRSLFVGEKSDIEIRSRKDERAKCEKIIGEIGEHERPRLIEEGRTQALEEVEKIQEHYLNKLDKGIFHKDSDREKFVHYVEILDNIIEKLKSSDNGKIRKK